MARVKVTAETVGYPDGITRVTYEPGVYELPDDLAGAFVVMKVAEYVSAPKPEPASPAKTADDGAGAAAQPKAARTRTARK